MEKNIFEGKEKAQTKIEDIEWKEASGPEPFFFQKEGDSIAGVLIQVTDEKYGKKYILEREGKTYSFFGSKMLDEHLIKYKLGAIIKVVLITDQHIFKNGNKGKMFKVFEPL